MIWLKRIFVGIGLLILLPLLLAALLSRSGNTHQSHVLPNGLSLNIEQITHGNRHKFGPPEFPVGVLKQIIPSLPVLRSVSHGTQDGSLVVWLSLEDKKQEWMVPMTNLVSVVARDQNGSRFVSNNIETLDEKNWRFRASWGGTQTPPPSSKWFISLISLEQYPKGESSFALDLLDHHKEIITTLEIKNPAKQIPKSWTSKPFPITRENKAVTVQLQSFTNSWRIRRAGRTQSEVPDYRAAWGFTQSGEPSSDWIADSGVMEDTFGNISTLGGDVEGNASMNASAWKLTYDFHKTTSATFPTNQIWEVTMEQPQKGKSNALNLSKNIMGVFIQLMSITGPKTKVLLKNGIPQSSSLDENASGTSFSSSSTYDGKNWIYTNTVKSGNMLVGLRYAADSHEYRVMMLALADDGNYKPLFSRYRSGIDRYMGIQHKIPEGPLRLKIIVQRVLQQSFMVKPSLDPPVHQFTRAKKITKRDPSTSKESVDLSQFYTQSLKDTISLHGHVGTSTVGDSFGLFRLPPGIQILNGIQWDLRGTVMLTGLCQYFHYLNFPEKINSIPIQQITRKLHFLHGCLWHERLGGEIGKYVVRFEDGNTESIPLKYGQNVGNILVNPKFSNPDVESATLVEVNLPSTNGNNNSSKQPFYHFEWTNPHPDQKITFIEFHSARRLSAPVLLGLTLEP